MEISDERKRLIEEDQRFLTLPRPDYSKMTNEKIQLRTKLMESAFKLAFKDDEEEDLDDL